MKQLVVALATLYLLTLDQLASAQKVNWVKTMDGTVSNYNLIDGLAVTDSAVYSFGSTTQGVAFTGSATTAPAGYFLAKHNHAGTLQWVVTMPSTPSFPAQLQPFHHATGVRLNANGELVVAGHVRNNVKFGNGANEKNLDATTYVGQSVTSMDIPFLARYNKSGTFIDGRIIARPGKLDGASPDVKAYDFVVDGLSNIYVVVSYSDSVILDFGLPSVMSFAAQKPWSLNGSYLVCKYDSNLNLKWARNIAGAAGGFVRNISIVIGGPNRLVIAGTFEGSLQFRNPASVFQDLTSYQPGSTATSGENAFLARLDTSGTFQWVKRPMEKPTYIADDGRYVNDIDVDGDGNIYLGGSLGGSAILGIGTPGQFTYPWFDGYHYLISKFDSHGNFLWVRMGMSQGFDPFAAGRKISCTPNGDCVIGGEFSANKLLMLGSTTEFTSDTPNNSLYEVLYNSSGQVVRGAHLANRNTGGTVYIPSGTQLTALYMKDDQHVVSAGNYFFTLRIAEGFIGQTDISTGGLASDVFMTSLAMTPPPPVVTGLEPASPRFLIYPNPVKNSLVVTASDSESKSTLRVELIDLHGRIVLQGLGSDLLSIDTSDLVSGIYVARIEDPAGRVEVKRILVSH